MSPNVLPPNAMILTLESGPTNRADLKQNTWLQPQAGEPKRQQYLVEGRRLHGKETNIPQITLSSRKQKMIVILIHTAIIHYFMHKMKQILVYFNQATQDQHTTKSSYGIMDHTIKYIHAHTLSSHLNSLQNIGSKMKKVHLIRTWHNLFEDAYTSTNNLIPHNLPHYFLSAASKIIILYKV